MGDDSDSYFVGFTTCHRHPFYKCLFDELLNSSYNVEGEYIFKNDVSFFGRYNCTFIVPSRLFLWNSTIVRLHTNSFCS